MVPTVKQVCRMSARRSMSIYPSSKARARTAGSHEISARHLKILGGNKEDDDLVTAILRAVDKAESCRSATTVALLKMALLNEGIRLAADLLQKESSPSVCLNLVAQNGNRP
jgi:hypothetical protein